MRISDWSSDVCSSDLGRDPGGGDRLVGICRQLPAVARIGTARLSDARPDRQTHARPDQSAGVPDRAGDWSAARVRREDERSEEHTSELQSLMRNSYAVFCLKKNNILNM